ncbi:hypothetical protein F5B20DRAFT_378590 [Whalleya microplaca]|nr:hypothetical protein F5B20DRAFT_378590 [Whalleya microplaca]
MPRGFLPLLFLFASNTGCFSFLMTAMMGLGLGLRFGWLVREQRRLRSFARIPVWCRSARRKYQEKPHLGGVGWRWKSREEGLCACEVVVIYGHGQRYETETYQSDSFLEGCGCWFFNLA